MYIFIVYSPKDNILLVDHWTSGGLFGWKKGGLWEEKVEEVEEKVEKVEEGEVESVEKVKDKEHLEELWEVKEEH